MTHRHLATLFVAACVLVPFLAPGAACAKMSVINSPHNLSASGGKGKHGVAFAEEERICVFCHVPHGKDQAALPLWSRELPPEGSYTKPYVSSTLKADPKPDKPIGTSRLCLSCHDGTIALGQFKGSSITSGLMMPSDADPRRNPNLTNDLSDDHPISFPYINSLAVVSDLAPPSSLPAQIRLEGGELLQCTSCHDPHNNEFGNFLVMNNSDPDKPGYLPGSPLCTTCHKNTGWDAAVHNPSLTVSLAAGCMNCHVVHSAPEPVRLLRARKEEENCITATCHNNGTTPQTANVQPLFTMTYRHPVDLTLAVHDEVETLPARQYHVECVDCHNPHQANNVNAPLASPPAIDGRLKGVKGISKDTLGVVVATNEYEVCYRCHSGGYAGNFSGVTNTKPNRMITELDQMKRFDGMNPSFHPVTADRRTNGASLLTQYQPGMFRVYCSDCHNSDQSVRAGGAGPNGPHGSMYEHILLAAYSMPAAGTPLSPYFSTLYDLCFRCHSESYVMTSGSSFTNGGTNEHTAHVNGRRTPCFACHDPHGVPVADGATSANNAHLINFDKGYAAGPLVPIPQYTSTGPASGSCKVTCHTNVGNTRSYSP